MEDAKWSDTAKGLVLSAAYCASFLGAWCLSFDQWYLPAGLRAVSLLFVPYRYWPYLFAGDAAALLVMRVPKAEQYSALWAYLSPFLLMPMVSSLALLLRNKLKTDQDKTRWLPLAAISIAVWSSISNMILNYCLYGPRASVSFANLYKFSIGDYLGILMVALPVLLFLGRHNGQVKPRHAVRDTLIAGAAIFTLYCVAAVPALEAAFHQGLLMLMLLPVVGLTFRHGWRGAAIGILAVNIVTAMKIPYMNTPGTYDAEIFVTQQALAVAATGLLMLGTVISDLFDKARVAGVAEKEALLLAQNSFLSSESKLRDQVIYMAQMQLRLDDYRDDLVEWLKQHRHFEAAMDLNSRGVAHARLFDQQALALYPMRIEAQGLYAVLNAEAFTDFWANETTVRYQLRGQPKRLTVDLQLAAYRCVCNAFALLSECDPEQYTVKTRVWRYGGKRGIAVFVIAKPAAGVDLEHSQAGLLAAMELEGRVKAHGGAVRRRHLNRISMLLSEPVDAESTLH
jgi:MASE1